MSEARINVRSDEQLNEELEEVSSKTRLSKSTIVREGVQEKLSSLKKTHPAYTSQMAEPAEVAA